MTNEHSEIERIPRQFRDDFFRELREKSILIDEQSIQYILNNFHIANISKMANNESTQFPRERHYFELLDINKLFVRRIISSCKENNRNFVTIEDINFALYRIHSRCGIFPCNPDDGDI